MSSDHDVARIVRSWLEEGGAAMPDRVLQTVADQLPRTAQRRPLGSTWRLLMTNPRLAFAAIGLIALLAIGSYALLPAATPASETTPSPSATPTSQPTPTWARVGGELDPGTQYTFNMPVTTTFSVPAVLPGWSGWKTFVTSGQGDPAESMIVNDAGNEAVVWSVPDPDGVYRDPCHWQSAGFQPIMQANVDNLLNALGSMPGVQVSGPTPTTFGGRVASSLTVTAPASVSGCDQGQIHYWTSAGRTEYSAAGTSVMYVIQYAQGTQTIGVPQWLVVVAWTSNQDPSAALSDMAPILDSIQLP